MKKLFIGVYNPSIVLTYISVFSALYGTVCLMSNKYSTLMIPIIALLISGVCDMFDGAVARKCKRTDVEKEFGIQLDSLADTIAFVVYPTLILLDCTNCHTISVLIACLYVFTGVMRLGWFNVTTEDNCGFFQGIPVTSIAIILPIVYFVLSKLSITVNIYTIIIQVVFTIVGVLFITNIKINKPNAKARAILGIAAIVIIILMFL